MADSWVTGAIRTSWTAGTTRMLAVRTMKRSVKIYLAWRHKDELGSVAAKTMKRSVKIFLA